MPTLYSNLIVTTKMTSRPEGTWPLSSSKLDLAPNPLTDNTQGEVGGEHDTIFACFHCNLCFYLAGHG